VAYYERRCRGQVFEPSWLFLHQMAKVLARQADGGCPSVRLTLKALSRFGLPPGDLGPSVSGQSGPSPAAYLFSFAREFADLVYFRLDHSLTSGAELLTAVKEFLAAGFALAFGSAVFGTAGPGGHVPFPSAYDAARGGATFACVGYDDKVRIHSERGALRVRSPWGPAWGESGLGWMPYRFLIERFACDFWTVVRPDWIAEGDLASPL
jgi:hypothetical protein